MGVEDSSLDDIIMEHNTVKRRPNNSRMYSNRGLGGDRTFQRRNRLFGNKFVAGRKRNLFNARDLIGGRSKMKIADARQKITPKPVADARRKLQARQSVSKDVFEEARGGKIPKVTFSNELAFKQRAERNNFHATYDQKIRSTRLQRMFANSGLVMKIAVKNDHAKMRSRVPDPLPGPAIKKKTFERLKITTINKDAIKNKSVPASRKPSSPAPPRPLRKRTRPERDDDTTEKPEYGKHRRQQKAEIRSDAKYKRLQLNSPGGDLRPMISKQLEMRRLPPSNKKVAPVGPSPIEGTKLQVSNLHPAVTEDDILELFSVLGAVRRARMVTPGEAEIVYVRHENAMTAFQKYNNRDLDGQPMNIKLSMFQKPKQSPAYSWMKDVKMSRKCDPEEVIELHGGVLQQALFKGGSTGTSTRPVVFTVKI